MDIIMLMAGLIMNTLGLLGAVGVVIFVIRFKLNLEIKRKDVIGFIVCLMVYALAISLMEK